MSTSQRKSRQRSTAAHWRRHFRHMRARAAALDGTDDLPRSAVELSNELVAVVHLRREARRLHPLDAAMGAVAAALVVTLDCGFTRQQFAAWLAGTAANVLRPR